MHLASPGFSYLNRRESFVSLSNGTGNVIAGTAFSEQVPPSRIVTSAEWNGEALETTIMDVVRKNGVECEPDTGTKHRRIAIVGRAPSSMMLAPFGDPNWEIWSLSNAAACGQIPDKHWHVWFEVHDLDEGFQRWPQQYKDWLQVDHGKPLYIQKPHPLIPHGIIFPWEKMFSEFGYYFNNSVSEMMAVALLEGATELALYGVDMAQSDQALHNGNGEYQHQRPSCEYMLGVARARLGKDKVYIPPESDLLKCNRVYAFPGEAGENVRKAIARKKELADRRFHMIQQEAQANEQAREWRVIAARHEGVLQQAKHMNVPAADLAPAQKELENAMQQHRLHKMNAAEAHDGVKKLEGAMEDNDYWITRLQA